MSIRWRFFVTVLLSAASLSARVIQVDIDSIVHPVTVSVVKSAIAEAQREHADALLIRLSTPGGFMDATREIIEEIFHSPVPVIMWTGPSGARAASAGFFLLESGDVAVMAPGTNTGASHPVLATGGEMDSVMKSKVENDAAALMRTIATHRMRNEQEAEQCLAAGILDLNRRYTLEELAGDNVMFAATGVTTGDYLRGVRFFSGGALTNSVVMRSRTRTVRFINAIHHFDFKPEY